MQDKDFDQLFSDKLGNLEVEPSRNVWKSITAELDSRRRKPLGIYLSIAATLLVMLTVGIYFLTRDEQIKPQQQVAVVKPKATEPIEVKKDEPEIAHKAQPLVAATPEVTIAQAKPVRTRKVVVKEVATKQEHAAQPAITEPVLANEQGEQLAQLPVQKTPGIKFTVPDKTTPLAEKIDDPIQVSTIAVQPSAEQKPAETLAAAPTRKHKIRGIGDLLNAVVSKIDKRKDKLIEFSSNDEDEPNVTGLNLGFIKIKKQSR